MIAMHKNNIEPWRAEAQRLLRLTIEVLENMMSAKGIIADAQPGSLRTFDRSSTPKYIEVLRGELVKLENMELVLAVVGTMKAGKSTTINAIVGTEVLPNRNSPMTALPTLIRHKPKQITPTLKLKNNQPINNLFKVISTCLENKLVNECISTESNADKDMMSLINNIKSNSIFKQDYQGAGDIFSCLKELSDLVRLSKKLGIDFPFSEYSNINQIPVITVEFAHLREAGKTYGQFTLLDTPGPNEAGQEYLRDMLNEQLQKSSAVLAVIDYEQMGSEADEEVRKQIRLRTKDCGEHLFTLVNKMDRKNRNGIDETEVKKYVAETLLKKSIKAEKVFPISAELAYLANRAKSEVFMHNKLPEDSWVKDFLREAFGREGKDHANNIAKVKSTANQIWNESGFNDLMEKVIFPAHTNVELLAIKSAISQSRDYMNKATSYLNNRLVSLSKSQTELDEKIDELRHGLKKIEGQEQVIDKLIKNASSTLYKELESTLIDAKKNLKNSTEILLKTGAYGLTKDKKGMLRSLRRDEVDTALDELQKRINKITEEELSKLKDKFVRIVHKVISDFDAEIVKVKGIVGDVNKSFVESDFSINIKVIDLSVDIVMANTSLAEKIVSEKEKKTYQVDADGFFNAFLRLLNSDWGKESKSHETEVFLADMNKVEGVINSDIEGAFKRYLVETENKIMSPLSSEIDLVFNSLKKEFNYVSSDLQQGINDKALEKNVQNDLRFNLEKLLQNFVDAKPDIEGIASDLDKTGAIV